MAKENILKEFLVAIGFEIDEDKLKKATQRVDDLGNGLIAFAETAIATATTLQLAVNDMANNLERLYRASVVTGAGAANLKIFASAASAMGQSTGEAMEMISRFGAKIAANPGYKYIVGQAGGLSQQQIKGANAQQLFEAFFQQYHNLQPGSGAYIRGAQQAQTYFGMSAELFAQYNKFWDVFKKNEQARTDWLKSVGITSERYEELSKQGFEFTQQLALMVFKWGVLYDLFAERLMPILTDLDKGFSVLIGWLVELDKKTHGISTIIAGLITVLGTPLAILMALRKALGLGGKAAGAAAEGAEVGELSLPAASPKPATQEAAVARDPHGDPAHHPRRSHRLHRCAHRPVRRDDEKHQAEVQKSGPHPTLRRRGRRSSCDGGG